MSALFTRLLTTWPRTGLRHLQGSLPEHLPSLCLLCQRWTRGALCPTCLREHAQPQPRCATCALPLPSDVLAHSAQCGQCISQPPPLLACYAAVPYASPWNTCVSSYKFSSNAGLAHSLARLVWHTQGVRDALLRCHLVMPLPLSAQRLAQRGYNQALQLARPLARWAAKPLDATSLARVRDTPPQHQLSRAERFANVKNAFAVLPERAAHVRGQHIALVDDVMTSGASLHAAANALHQSGAASVRAVVFARTGMG
jgi:ComF family protein